VLQPATKDCLEQLDLTVADKFVFCPLNEIKSVLYMPVAILAICNSFAKPDKFSYIVAYFIMMVNRDGKEPKILSLCSLWVL